MQEKEKNVEDTDFLFDAGKLKGIQNEIYEQSTMLFDLLFHLQQELDGISIKWQGDAAAAFMGEIHIWWEASYHQVERLQEVGKLLSQAEERVRLCEEQVKQETGGWFG